MEILYIVWVREFSPGGTLNPDLTYILHLSTTQSASQLAKFSPLAKMHTKKSEQGEKVLDVQRM